MIIGISGYAGSGKDTIGIIIQYLHCINVGNLTIEDVVKDYKDHEWWLEDQSEWYIRKFAGKLKDIAAHLLGIEPDLLEDQEYKKTVLDKMWWTTCDEGVQPMTVREFLQKLGTDALRKGLHDNTWVNALMADYQHDNYSNAGALSDDEAEKSEYNGYPNWIITDVRFPNEAQAIKDRGGILIRVTKPGVEAINNHPSETSLDSWKFDYNVANVSGIFELKENIKEILKHANLL